MVRECGKVFELCLSAPRSQEKFSTVYSPFYAILCCDCVHSWWIIHRLSTITTHCNQPQTVVHSRGLRPLIVTLLAILCSTTSNGSTPSYNHLITIRIQVRNLYYYSHYYYSHYYTHYYYSQLNQ